MWVVILLCSLIGRSRQEAQKVGPRGMETSSAHSLGVMEISSTFRVMDAIGSSKAANNQDLFQIGGCDSNRKKAER